MDDTEKLVEHGLSSTEVFDGRLLHVFTDEVRLPDGETSTREWIDHPGAAAVLPVFETGEVMLVKQFRYPVRKVFYEVPAGKIDPGEEPLETARRELEEEAGLRCREFREIGRFHPSIGYTNEVIHLYVAWGIRQMEQLVDDEEFLIRERISFREAASWVHSGKITDGKTMVALLRAWHWWQDEGPFEVPGDL